MIPDGEENLENIFEKGYNTKKEISLLEENIEKYKKICDKIMDEKNVEFLTTSKFKLTKKDIFRQSLSKKDIKPDYMYIWDECAKFTCCHAFYLTKKGERSPPRRSRNKTKIVKKKMKLYKTKS